MGYAAHRKDFDSYVSHLAAGKREVSAKKTGILRRIFNAIVETRHSEVDRQLTHFLAHSGRAFTDDLEREITQRLIKSNWSVNSGPSPDDRRFP